jgi:hypothetical protein
MSGESGSAGRPDLVAGGRARSSRTIRIALMAPAALALATGLWAGFARLGWAVPQGAALAALHAPLLICGLFGTLIGLERVVALRRGWAYAAPALAGCGSLALLAGGPQAAGAAFYLAASGVLALASLRIVVLQPAPFTAALLAGACAWFVGNLLWLGERAVPEIAGWWLGFLILTIAGERLELSRLLAPRRGSAGWFLLAVGLLLAGAGLGILAPAGALAYGAGLLALVAWLGRHDIAWRNLGLAGQTRFMAACMLAGYAWLGLAGLVLIAMPFTAAAFGYDIVLHAVLIGFVLSMVFGHAPIILPAVARIRVPYAPALYGPLALLHGSVALRVGAGLSEWQVGRQASGLFTLAALLAYAICAALAARRAARSLSP